MSPPWAATTVYRYLPVESSLTKILGFAMITSPLWPISNSSLPKPKNQSRLTKKPTPVFGHWFFPLRGEALLSKHGRYSRFQLCPIGHSPCPVPGGLGKMARRRKFPFQLSHISSKKVNPLFGLKPLKTKFLFLVIYDRRKTKG
jgi:hypothetical protein